MSIDTLKKIRENSGEPRTIGLSDEVIKSFLSSDPKLKSLLDEAESAHNKLRERYSKIIDGSEADAILEIQKDFLNFYPEDGVAPFIPLSAKGPWIVTAYGAVVYDSGGYGMLGLGHNPDDFSTVIGKERVMANVMTPNLIQKDFTDKLKSIIGLGKECPYHKFACVNSGSEANSLACRIIDLNSKIQTDPGGKHEGKNIKAVGMRLGFHGRTNKPAQFSHSSRRAYQKLASFRGQDNVVTIEPNDINQLKQVFIDAERYNSFYEVIIMEPVMGEGFPGLAITPEYYQLARELAQEHGSLLLVDSVQAAFRVNGVLSVFDYPGFENCTAPHMESFSKAVNGGQFPLSILGLDKQAAALYQKGVYGNTMTTNPRALAVGLYVLEKITPKLRQNIVEKGKEFSEKLSNLVTKYPNKCISVSGTGLLCSIELADDIKVWGANSIEEKMREKGVNLIHGGKNSLRFTPYFGITSAEIDMMVKVLEDSLNHE